MTTLYGIKNCDTIKKARKWLEQHHIPFTFHDYRTDGLDTAWLAQRIDELGIEALVNKRGTTYRQLDEAQKAAIEDQNKQETLEILIAMPAIIKRPLLRYQDKSYLGFKADHYASLFNAN
ncbi:ArsC family reductase [Lacimicrobium alkaliphilum]|uniref:Arsenate reductase n=1 Tax=Lacimicrobium alkaliphilum TaxID=1526571 RepID=A0ABQ1R2A5_9ALTE|nr:ArsC family reductase [Lacimicrobium alkaliphilum]GGD53847.1 arsenate reductase [Lacimicrobium alkaliphilum]